MIGVSRNLSCLARTMMLITVVFISLVGAGSSRKRDDYVPKIIEHPESVIVKKNQPATLNCRAEGRPQPQITWLKDGELISDDSHRTIGITGALYFLRVVSGKNRDDTGTYQCVATNEMGVAYSNNATLMIAFLRTDFRKEPVDTVAIVGEPIVLECSPPRGYPLPSVTWEKDDAVLEDDGHQVVIMEDGNLMISKARLSDSGSYICLVENGYFEVRKSSVAEVTIHARPTFVNPPEDVSGIPGETINIQCSVQGDPRPTVMWSKYEGELPRGRFTIMSDNTLRIYHVTTADEGIYRCSAENIWGSAEMEAMLTVTLGPSFSKTPVDTTVKLGETAVFECTATGNPQPVIFWQKETMEPIFSSENSRFSVTPDGSLQIPLVTADDEGYYVCTAYSSVGSIKERAFLDVIVPQDHQRPVPAGQPPPIIQYGPSNQTLVIGITALFHCQATGVPQPVIEWTKDGNPVELSTQRYVSRFAVQESGSLQISSLLQRDSGLYTCTAMNDNGETRRSATLAVRGSQGDFGLQEAPSLADFPNPPGQPQASNISLHGVRLQWDEPSQSVVYYQLESHRVNQDLGWTILSRQILGTSYLLHNLEAGATYLFVVRAVSNNIAGLPSVMSDPITTMRADTTEGTPTMAQILAQTNPRITSSVALSQAAIKIVWEVERNKNAVEGYFVKYKPRYSDHSFSSMEVVTGSTNNRILTGLEPAMEYLVIVQPFHGDVEGPDSEPVAVRTLSDGRDMEEASGPVNSVLKEKLDTCGITIVDVQPIGPYSLKVMWAVERYSGYIDGYHIRFRPGRDNKEYAVESVRTDRANEAVLRSLAPWTEYTIAVQPYKDRFTGKFSQEVHARTDEGVPNAAPVKVEVKGQNSTSIFIKWEAPPPHTIPGILLGYHVYCRGNKTSQHQNRTTDNKDVIIDGLTAGLMYGVQVAAYTRVGIGPTNKVIYVIIPGDEVSMRSYQQFGILVQTKWIIIFVSAVIFIISFIVFVFAYRKHNDPKHGSKKKASMSKEKEAVGNRSHHGSNASTNHKPVWTDQTWPPPHICQDNKCNHHGSGCHGNNPGCMTTKSCYNGKSSMNGTLDKKQIVYPSWNGTHPWKQYSTYDPEAIKHSYPPIYQTTESMNGIDTPLYCETNPTLPNFNGSISPQGKVDSTKPSPCSTPEYAIVDNDEYISSHANHPEGAVITVMPHDTMPYASATLFLAPNMREYMAHRVKCQENSADSRCSSRMNNSCIDSGMYGDTGRAIYSETGSLPGRKLGRKDPSLSCVSEYATIGRSDSGNSSLADDRGRRRKFRIRNALSKKHPARNWKDLLPPPPEQPPVTAPSSPIYSCPPVTYSPLRTQNYCQSSNKCDSNTYCDMRCQERAMSMPRDRAPLPPLYHSMPPNEETASLLLATEQSNLPKPREHFVPNTLSIPQLHVEQTTPLLSNMPNRTDDAITSGQVFEDPRHEQLGKELLEFNDEIISQSEICSETEEEQRQHEMGGDCSLFSSGHNIDCGDVSYPADANAGCHRDSDNDIDSICTDSMLATWDPVNGSTNSSRHDSCASLTSEGSAYFTNLDFASTMAGGDEFTGMHVSSEQSGQEIGETRLNATNSPVLHRSQPLLATINHSNRHHGNGSSKHSSPAGSRKGSLKHHNKSVFIRDTNDHGLRVTANPMVTLAHNKTEKIHV